MKLILLCCLSIFAGSAAEPPGAAESLELRAEIYRQGMELQDLKLRLLRQELDSALVQQQGLSLEDQALMNELTDPDAAAGEIGARHEEISNSDLPRVQSQREEIRKRIDSLSAQLEQVELRRQSLAKLLKDTNP